MSETGNAAGDIDALTRRVRELSDQVLDQARRNGRAYLEGYERLLDTLLDLERRAAEGSGQDWASALASTHASLVRQTSEMFLGAVRDHLRS
ncbi:hypothetical protein OF117_00230 [Geodermatophilus sp. YIM 151500]|uniref:hypothetical protein n=1 Tax=Geodermatophilus sp. YIM 151500 TaxID=2984531 RepID=UPI0021E4A3A2|nr:hypothetical protein [Geodermatophilus sp. YIM 151500]MCV2487773.1 hypothetical protein [Geodermatophilus sp. YIM 151500]